MVLPLRRLGSGNIVRYLNITRELSVLARLVIKAFADQVVSYPCPVSREDRINGGKIPLM
jgi:hypothetical protein